MAQPPALVSALPYVINDVAESTNLPFFLLLLGDCCSNSSPIISCRRIVSPAQVWNGCGLFSFRDGSSRSRSRSLFLVLFDAFRFLFSCFGRRSCFLFLLYLLLGLFLLLLRRRIAPVAPVIVLFVFVFVAITSIAAVATA